MRHAASKVGAMEKRIIPPNGSKLTSASATDVLRRFETPFTKPYY
jgi:hypothetical protein